MNHTLFISDLHLQAERPDITARFRSFLETAHQADAVYILGDLFEAWIGDDDRSDFNLSILTQLRQLTDKNTPVFFMRGNRDFLIGKAFADVTGCKLLADPSVIDLYGTPVLLTHGDMLCTQDRWHQQFRRLAQNQRYNQFFLMLPLFVRKALAGLIRSASKKHTRVAKYTTMDVVQVSLEQLMRSYGVLKVIHGHTHRPATHSFNLDSQPATRIVLGDWDQKSSVLRENL